MYVASAMLGRTITCLLVTGGFNVTLALFALCGGRSITCYAC